MENASRRTSFLSLPLAGRVARRSSEGAKTGRVGVATMKAFLVAPPPRPPLRSADPPRKGGGIARRHHTFRTQSVHMRSPCRAREEEEAAVPNPALHRHERAM